MSIRIERQNLNQVKNSSVKGQVEDGQLTFKHFNVMYMVIGGIVAVSRAVVHQLKRSSFNLNILCSSCGVCTFF